MWKTLFLCEVFVAFNLQISFLLQLHGGMCKPLSNIYCKILNIFPALEESRPRSKSGIQALCSLHVALEKARLLLQHCSECSKLYLVCLVLVIGFPLLDNPCKVCGSFGNSKLHHELMQSLGFTYIPFPSFCLFLMDLNGCIS